MKSSKPNTKIPLPQFFRHPRYDISTSIRSLIALKTRFLQVKHGKIGHHRESRVESYFAAG